DIAFTDDVLHAVSERLCVDETRIYATGMSQGGGFVGNQLACDSEMSQRIAAFAPVAGAHYVTSASVEADCHPDSLQLTCNPGRNNVAIMHTHGGDDKTIHYEGGFRRDACYPDIQYWVEEWAKRDGLDLNPATKPIDKATGAKIISYGDGLVTLVFAGE